MRASFADFTLWEVKFKVPRERAAANVLDVEDDVEGRSGRVGDVERATVETDETLWEEPCRGTLCRLNCSAFARAFSCVRTKLASCYYKALVSAPVLGAARPAATRTHLYEQLSVF